MGFFAILGLIAWAILMVMIFKKAGYSGLQTIFLFIPLVNVVVFVWFALSEWPIEKEMKEMKARLVFANKDKSSRNNQ